MPCELGWGWVGVNYGYWIIDPHLGTFLWPPTINLCTSTLHQEDLFQRKETLHNHVCTLYRQVHTDWSDPYSIFIKGARDEAPLTTIFKLIQYLL